MEITKQGTAAYWKLIVSMVLFGTIGIFVRGIPLPSSMIALMRSVIGMCFLLIIIAFRKQPIQFKAIKNDLLCLILSGMFLGVNWILLFDSYRYTSVATSTLCYYMAPILVILLSPVLLKEKLTLRKVICVGAALLGMVFISGVLENQPLRPGEGSGILLGLGAAVLYACIMLINQKMGPIDAFDKTVIQLGISAIVLLPYCLLTARADVSSASPIVIGQILLVGVVHTGLTYSLYFGAMGALPGQTVAILSYIDPVVAVLCSVLILHESMDATEVMGTVLIIGAAVISELPARSKGEIK